MMAVKCRDGRRADQVQHDGDGRDHREKNVEGSSGVREVL